VGSNTVVTVLLTPPADLPLGDYNGTLVVRGSTAGLSVPYSFPAISDGRGHLQLTAEDEYTYFAAGSPRVTNATVTLSDALSGTPVLTNYTGLDGTVLLSNLTEAYYLVDVRADDHSPFRQSALVGAGMTTNVVAFLSRDTVHFTFTVVPTTIEDRYSMTVESTFETQVPVPVVTIQPASVDLAQYPANEFQIEFTIANHGLIAADHVRLDIPSTARLEFTPLITEVGRLAANSSLTVPVLVRRLGPKALSDAEAAPPAPPKDYQTGLCSVTASMLWDYLCGPNVVDRNTAFYVFDSTGCDLVALYRQVYHIAPDEPGPGPGITSDEYFDWLESLNPVLSFGPPPGYHFECNATPPGGKNLRSGPTVNPVNGKPLGGPPAKAEVCAKVNLRLDQRAVLTRDAFKATLELDNDTLSSLQNVLVNLDIRAENGASANTIFGIRPPEVSGFNAVDGTGTLGGRTVGTATWILVPTLDASPTTGSAMYLVGGTLSYQQDDVPITVPLAPAPIWVFPQPELVLRYFHERDVFADDPFTPEVEPSLPYSLGVQIVNVGSGAARNLKLSGGRPQIVDNEKGLLIEFRILGTQLENQSLSPALDVDFGRIEPGTNKIARWLFTSSIQGSFTNFSASFEHLDALGVKRLSLVRSVEIHQLNHIVNADRAFDDARPDFLASLNPGPEHLPNTLYLSDGSTSLVAAVTSGGFSGLPSEANQQVTLTATAPAGWVYFRLPDPAGTNLFKLAQVLREDGSEIAFRTNAWTTDRFFRGGDLRPILTNQVHILDYNSSGTYTLVYETIAGPVIDTQPPASTVAALPAVSPSRFAVSWSGTDDLSGIASFDIYVSVNGGAFAPWLEGTAVSGAVYTGQPGATYAFYSIAKDNVGNTQTPPAGAQAQTTVSAANPPPTITLGPDQTINAGDTLTLTAQAQGGTPPLTFTLLSGTPPGVLLNRTTGSLLWQTTAADGSISHTLGVIVTDSASPSLSATSTVRVLVRSLNTPPTLDPIADRVIREGERLVITNHATDVDLPPQTLTFSLASGAPSGASINPATGVFVWQPTFRDGPSTNHITVNVTDNGPSPLVASRTFTVIVRQTQAEVTVRAGWTNVLAGAASSVPLTLLGDADLTEVAFNLDTSAAWLGDLAISSPGPNVASAALLPLGGDSSAIRFTLTGAAVGTDRLLADLAFTAAASEHSAIVPLQLSGLTGQSPTVVYAETLAVDGFVIVIGREPVLLAFGGDQPTLTLFGNPGVTCEVETTGTLEPANWVHFDTVTLTTTYLTLPLSATDGMRCFRARAVGRGPVLLALGGDQPTLTLSGNPGVTYEVETTGILEPANWVHFDTVTLTTTYFTLPLNATEAMRYFRARGP
jgi:hypothetical protein